MYIDNDMVLVQKNDYAVIKSGQDVWVGKQNGQEYEYVIGDWHIDNVGMAQAYDVLDQLADMTDQIVTNTLF